MTRALVPMADGVEEMEAVIVIDVLRRAKWDVVSAAVRAPGPGAGAAARGAPIVASRGVGLVADAEWDDVDPATFDVLVLPGGAGGTARLCADSRVLAAIRHFAGARKPLGAICAAPLALQAAGVLAGRKATCHPDVRARLTAAAPLDDRVVADGRLVTSQGPGTAFEFALALIALVDGRDAADAVAKGLVLVPRA